MRISVDDDICRGHGACAALLPEVFTMTDAGYAEAPVSELPASLDNAVAEAVASCPERAIYLKEESCQ